MTETGNPKDTNLSHEQVTEVVIWYARELHLSNYDPRRPPIGDELNRRLAPLIASYGNRTVAYVADEFRHSPEHFLRVASDVIKSLCGASLYWDGPLFPEDEK